MKAILGLGNPGNEYEKTRHNIGFEVVDYLVNKGTDGKYSLKFRGAIAVWMVDGEKVFLVKPMTFMNLSGACVSELVKFYQIEPADVLVICDDVSLPFGKLRLRAEGGHGGHNGLKDIQAKMGTPNYPRLRVGVGEKKGNDLSSHVLGRFAPDEMKELGSVVDEAAQAADCWVREGIQVCMNRFNGPAK